MILFRYCVQAGLFHKDPIVTLL